MADGFQGVGEFFGGAGVDFQAAGVGGLVADSVADSGWVEGVGAGDDEHGGVGAGDGDLVDGEVGGAGGPHAVAELDDEGDVGLSAQGSECVGEEWFVVDSLGEGSAFVVLHEDRIALGGFDDGLEAFGAAEADGGVEHVVEGLGRVGLVEADGVLHDQAGDASGGLVGDAQGVGATDAAAHHVGSRDVEVVQHGDLVEHRLLVAERLETGLALAAVALVHADDHELVGEGIDGVDDRAAPEADLGVDASGREEQEGSSAVVLAEHFVVDGRAVRSHHFSHRRAPLKRGQSIGSGWFGEMGAAPGKKTGSLTLTPPRVKHGASSPGGVGTRECSVVVSRIHGNDCSELLFGMVESLRRWWM